MTVQASPEYPALVAVSNVYITFTGTGFFSGATRQFTVMAFNTPPTPTGGYAIWQPVARPLRRALTVFQGFNPQELTLDILFARWDQNNGWGSDDQTGMLVEADINKLEWMGGQNYIHSQSPAVTLAASNSSGDLIPGPYQNLTWVVTGITWGRAWRSPGGFRVWQEANVTLQAYLNIGAPAPRDSRTPGAFFTSRPGRDTALLIARAPQVRAPGRDVQTLARDILHASQNNPLRGTSIKLERRSVSWRIRHGLNVWVPAHQVS